MQQNNLFQKLVQIFSKFPGTGQRTAGRFVFYLIKMPEEEFDDFIKTVQSVKKSIKLCPFCFNPFENTTNKLCPICRDKTRKKDILCIIEKETDLLAIEKTKKYKGLYFILGGTVANLKKEDIKKLRIDGLKERIKRNNFNEIIIATNPNAEGEATSLLLEREIKKIYNKKLTHLGKGLPVGGEVEYADEETLTSAFEGRK